MSRHTRHARWNYPLWIGLGFVVAVAVFHRAFFTPQPHQNPEQLSAPSVVDAASQGEKEAVEPRERPTQVTADKSSDLVFDIIGRSALEPGMLQRCLTDSKAPRAEVRTENPKLFFIERRDLRHPLRLDAIEGRWVLTTRAKTQPHIAAALHLGVMGCLFEAGAMVLDRGLKRRFEADDWPRLSKNGGLPVDSLVTTEKGSDFLKTRGLERLGRRELVLDLDGLADADAKDRISVAAVAAVINDKDKRLFRGPDGARIRFKPSSRQPGALDVVWEDGAPQKARIPRAQPALGGRHSRVGKARREGQESKSKQPRRRVRPAKKNAFRPDYR